MDVGKMETSITHAAADLMEVGHITAFDKMDAQIKTKGTLAENSFELTLRESVWEKSPVHKGDFLYIDGTEWGGPVDVVCHDTAARKITLEGPTWRGLLLQRVIEPDAGAAFRTILPMDANAALQTLLGNAYNWLFAVDETKTGVLVDGAFCYPLLLDAMETILAKAEMRLRVSYEASLKRVLLRAEPIADYSHEIDLSVDYGVHIKTALGRLEHYHRIIVLGGGDPRLSLSVYRLEDGQTTTECPADWDFINERATILDAGTTDAPEQLLDNAMKRMEEFSKKETIEMDTSKTTLSLRLGDKVSARDRVTGLAAVASVTEMVLSMDAKGMKIQTKVG